MLEKKYPYYLANKAQTSKEWMDVVDKYSGKVATRVAVPDAKAVEQAIAAAVKASGPMREFKPWARQAELTARFAEASQAALAVPQTAKRDRKSVV